MSNRTISAILPAARKPGRFELLVDGEALATVSIDAIERLHLATGALLDETALAAVEREGAILATYDRAMNMLATRGRSAAELRRQLVRKGEPADQVDAAIQRLLAAGFLDDAAFARQFARSKALGSGLSRRRIQQELVRRGVTRDTVDSAIAEVFAEEAIDEDASLERAAQKKLRSLSRLEPAVRNRRLYAYLARRGYESADITRIIRQESAGEEFVVDG